MGDLIVTCNSVDGVVEYKSDHGVLSTLKWSIYEEAPGFYVRNSDILVDVYRSSFYIVDHVAAVQFIMNVAAKIVSDQALEDIIFLNTDGKETEIPYFLPYTVSEDEDVVLLPHQQLAIIQLWSNFILNFHGYLSVDLIDAAYDRDVLDGFLDLVNAELSLICKGE